MDKESIKHGDKLFLVTRRDLSPGYQAVQSCHALRQFVHDHPDVDKAWFENSNYIALLSVADEESLREILDVAWYRQIRHSTFCEPDIGNEITAIALEPCAESIELCKDLPLALRSIHEHRNDA